MKLHRVTAVLVVLSCIAAVGVASTTLGTTLETRPDEAINLDYDTVPISPDQAGEIRRAVTGSDAGGERNRGSNPADGASGGSERADGGGGEANSQGGASDQSSSSSASASAGSESPTRSWLDRLVEFLKTWLPLLVISAVVVAVAALLVRHRDRLGRLRDTGAAGGDAAASRRPEPRNAVERAWLSVLAAADVEDPWQRTPEECASVAVESGLDPEGVERLRRVFEEVRYGDCELTDARRQRMERGLSELGLGRTDR